MCLIQYDEDNFLHMNHQSEKVVGRFKNFENSRIVAWIFFHNFIQSQTFQNQKKKKFRNFLLESKISYKLRKKKSLKITIIIEN